MLSNTKLPCLTINKLYMSSILINIEFIIRDIRIVKQTVLFFADIFNIFQVLRPPDGGLAAEGNSYGRRRQKSPPGRQRRRFHPCAASAVVCINNI